MQIKRIRTVLKTFGVCLLIVASIYLVQIIGYSFEKYVITSDGLINQALMGIAGIFEWAIIIFLIVIISPPFRKFFFRWFNTESEVISETSIKEKTHKLTDRQFQTELLKIQLDSDVYSSFFTVFISILASLLAVILTLSVTLSEYVSFNTLLVIAILPIGIILAFAIFYWAFIVSSRNTKIKHLLAVEEIAQNNSPTI